MGLESFSQPATTDGARSLVNLFEQGFVDSIKKPVIGYRQLLGEQVQTAPVPETQAASKTEPAWARSAGEMVGSAVLFYAAATFFKHLPKVGSIAPMAAGATLGFLEPVDSGKSTDRFVNCARGATTMFVMERMPGILCKQGFNQDLLGNLLNVAYTGAAAGALDTNVKSILSDGKFSSLQTTATAAGSWALVGSAFHVASLGAAESYRVIADSKSPQLLLLGGKHTESCYTLREFLNSLSPYGVKYRQVDFLSKPLFGSAVSAEHPLVVFPDGSRMDGTNLQALATKLNLHTTPSYNRYRVAVIGAGPAGVQTAINAASELPLRTERVAVIADILGGQARYTSSVKNYMGFPDVTGSELMTRGIKGAGERGAEFVVNRVRSIEESNGHKVLTLKDGSKVEADAVVLATGMKYNQLDIPGMDHLQNRGVYTLADASEAAQMKGQRVVLVGAGNSAGQAAINFSRHVSEVHMMVRGPKLESSMSEYLVNEIANHPNINVHLNSEVKAVDGLQSLENVTMQIKMPSGEAQTQKLDADAMYVYIGGKPNTAFLHGSGLAMDAKGFLLTGDQVASSGLWPVKTRAPLPYETNIPGVFAAGDVNAANPQKRIVSAVGDAGKLIGSLHSYLPSVPVGETLPAAAKVPAHSLWQPSIKLPSLTVGLLSGRLDEKPALAP